MIWHFIMRFQEITSTLNYNIIDKIRQLTLHIFLVEIQRTKVNYMGMDRFCLAKARSSGHKTMMR